MERRGGGAAPPTSPPACSARVCGKRWISDLASGRRSGPQGAPTRVRGLPPAGPGTCTAAKPGYGETGQTSPCPGSVPERPAPRVSTAPRAAGAWGSPAVPERERTRGGWGAVGVLPAAEPRFVLGGATYGHVWPSREERGAGCLPEPPCPFSRVTLHACAPACVCVCVCVCALGAGLGAGFGGGFFLSFFFSPRLLQVLLLVACKGFAPPFWNPILAVAKAV